MDEQGALGFEGAQLGGIAEPAAGVILGRWRRIKDTVVSNVGEAGIAKKRSPFFG